MKKQVLQGKVSRLYVFNYLKGIMDREGRCPTAEEVAQHTPVKANMAAKHMRALNGADGLSMPVPTRLEREDEIRDIPLAVTSIVARGSFKDPNMIPIDTLVSLGFG